MRTFEEYLQRVAELERMAAAEPDRRHRSDLRQLAASWRRTAEYRSPFYGPYPPQPYPRSHRRPG